MSVLDKSGQAFPVFVDCGPEDRGVNEGLTRRAYFAAHAPAEVPDWFRPDVPTVAEQTRDKRPPAPADVLGAEVAQRLHLSAWISDPAWEPWDDPENPPKSVREAEAVKAWCENWDGYRAVCSEVRQLNDTRRLALWRWHLADAMLETEKSK